MLPAVVLCGLAALLLFVPAVQRRLKRWFVAKPDYSSVDYWERRYAAHHQGYEWYAEPEAIVAVVREHLPTPASGSLRVLDVGCGNSRLCAALADSPPAVKPVKCVNIDYSATVIADMQARFPGEKDSYVHMDATDLEFRPRAFHAVFEKGTLDGMVQQKTPRALRMGTRVLTEAARVLKPAGRLVCCSVFSREDQRKRAPAIAETLDRLFEVEASTTLYSTDDDGKRRQAHVYVYAPRSGSGSGSSD